MKILSPLTLYLAVLLSTGCGNALKSEYRTPQVNYPAHWQHETDTDAPPPFNWRDFHDPDLKRWLQQVMANNNDLAVAALRLYDARLKAEQVDIKVAPSVNTMLNAGANIPLNNSLPWNKTSSGSLDTRYEVDLWGKLSRQRDAAEWARQATEQDLRTTRLKLLADAGTNYWHIGFFNQQIGISRESIVYAKDTLRLATALYRAGSTTALDRVDAGQSLLTQESHLLALQYERQQALNEQVVLLGAPPGSAVVDPARLPVTPLPQINTGIPASVLSRRPDISAKELRLCEALGTSSTELLEFLSNPVGSVGAGLTLPFLEWRQMNVDIKIDRNDYERLRLEFQQALYKAMADVNDALSAARAADSAGNASAGGVDVGAQVGTAERGALPAGCCAHHLLAGCAGAGAGRKSFQSVQESGENLPGIWRFSGITCRQSLAVGSVSGTLRERLNNVAGSQLMWFHFHAMWFEKGHLLRVRVIFNARHYN